MNQNTSSRSGNKHAANIGQPATSNVKRSNGDQHDKRIAQLEASFDLKLKRLESDYGLKLKHLQTEVADLKKSEAKLEGQVDVLIQQVKENTQSLTTIKAVDFTANDSDDDGQDDDDSISTNSIRSTATHRDKYGHHYLPNDSYTFFAVAKYFTGCRPKRAFVVASVALLVQLVTLSIFIADVFEYRDKENMISVPPGVGLPVRISQLLALLISSWNQDEIRTSFNVMQLGYDEQQVKKISSHATPFKWYLSIFLRVFIGCLTLTVTFVLILNSVTVRDVMLDFAAVTFVSEIDNAAFLLAHWKYMGSTVHELATKTKTVPVKKAPHDDFFRVHRLVSMLIIMGVMCGVWAWITIRQSSGYYMDDTIFVQFGDDFSPVMAAFSGLYHIEVDDALDGMRVTYVEVKSENLGAESAYFYYCIQDSSWMFRYGENPNEDDGFFADCWYKARSAETEDLDITKSSSVTWYVADEEISLDMPLQHFQVVGHEHYYGQSCESDSGCGDRMKCEDKESSSEGGKFCVCEVGYFGINCEFLTPCQSLEIDPNDLKGFIGTRIWSRTYTSVRRSGKESPIQVYGKPIFFGDSAQEGTVDVMMFNGRRWILTDSAHIKDYENLSSGNNERHLAEFLANNFHAYWSNYTFYFASEPVDVGTPTDAATPVGLQWFRFDASGAEGVSLQSGDDVLQGKMAIDANLFCAVCNDEANPCFYGASCGNDGTCSCITGSSGKLCQIPPDGNGFCDNFFNTPEFSYDGGDCCQETCTSTEQHSCGNGMIQNDVGVFAYGYVGYPNCVDPRFLKLYGSATLYKIVERGFLRCGAGRFEAFVELVDGEYSGFEVDLCKSIAAAVLGDPEAFEIIETTASARFNDLSDEKYDVLIRRTTHTAERDIYQGGAKVGFSFVPTPTLYDGLRYGGIPPFNECADKLDFGSAECLSLKICVRRDTTWQQVTESLFPESMIVRVESGQEPDGLEGGLCNVIAGEISTVAEYAVRGGGFTGPAYEIGENIYSKEPLSAVTRQDDRVWFKFVSWVFEALIQAEESGVTGSTANTLAPTEVFGEQFRDMFRNAVGANGNYGEIYEKNLGGKIPRTGLNNINEGNSGTIYAFPFGAIETQGEDPIIGGTIEAIRRRGALNCGIKVAPGFAEFDPETGRWRGFEVDFCQGIAAALLGGSPNVNFIPLSSNQRFPAMAEGVVDVLAAGTTHTLTREVQESITGEGFDFTPTIFHDGMGFGGRPHFVACAENLIVDSSSLSTECALNTRICVPDGSTWLEALRGQLGVPEANIFVAVSHDESYERLVSGDCNVFAGESPHLAERTVRGLGYPLDEDYVVSTRKFTKEPLAIVSRSDDNQFSDFLRWIVFGFFHAAEQGITRELSHAMPSTSLLFGDVLSGMWRHAIDVVGNYDEMFQRNFNGILEREGLNTLNNANGPQFYSKPGITIEGER